MYSVSIVVNSQTMETQGQRQGVPMTQRRRGTAQSSALAYCVTLVRTFPPPPLRQHLHQKI